MRTLTRVSIQLILITSSFCQNPIGNAQPKVADAQYQDSKEGLKSFLDEVLAAAKNGDKAKVSALIKETEIPDYEAWYRKEYPADKADSWIGPYGTNLQENEQSLASEFVNLAGRHGLIGTRKVEDKDQTNRGLEWGMLHSARDPLDIYFAGWITDEGGKPHVEPIGYFIYIDGMFRWDSLVRFMQPVKVQRLGTEPPAQIFPAADQSAPAEIFHVGKNVSAPKVIYSPDPDLTNLPKHHPKGIVVLAIVLGADGIARDIKVTRSLSPEVDSRAVEVLRKWRFQPAMKNGTPVAVAVNIEMQCSY